ncbi:MAG: hypothetical protein RBS77_06180 [Candidatus Moranbacteria bacterium]|jgi:hypothetical protein|nr:hypothetical protein [Candidatus Moranbacteria bacterium]
MNYIRHQQGLFERFVSDKRLSPFHISLYMALFQLWNSNRFRNPFPVAREEVMELAHIGSVGTYLRCIRQLHDWGYIEYAPSFHPGTGTKVSCTKFDKAGDTGADTSGDKATGISGDTALLKKNTNITNRNKQGPPHFFENGKEKKGNSSSRYHVVNDKDYGEPL